MKIQSFVRDHELLVLLSKSGEIWTLNLAQLHNFIFKGPIPLFRTHTIKGVESGDKLQIISYEVNNPENRPLKVSQRLINEGIKGLLTGDIALVSTKENLITSISPREDILSSMEAQTALLMYLTHAIDGDGQKAINIVNEEFKTLLPFFEQRESAGFFYNNDLLKQLQKLPPETLKKISDEIKSYKQNKRHNFTLREWNLFSEHFDTLLDEKKVIEEELFNKKLKNTLFKTLKTAQLKIEEKFQNTYNAKNLKNLAYTMKSFILERAPEKACSLIGGLGGACTAVWASSALWEQITKITVLAGNWAIQNTPIALGGTYLFYNALSTMSLYSMFALVMVAGGIAGYFTNRSTNRAITTIGLRFIAHTVGWLGWLPFDVLRQKNLPLASQENLHWKSKNAINSVFASKKEILEKRKKLVAEIASKKNLKANAMLIAHAVVAGISEISPATLLLYSAGVINGETKELTPSEIQKWLTLSKELEQVLPEFSEKNILDLSSEEIAEAFEIAKNSEDEIAHLLDSKWYQQLTNIKSAWNYLFTKTPLEALRHFPTPMKSYKFYKKLKLAEMDDFSADVSINQFKVGYLMLPLIYGWMGAFANPDNSPEDLSCNPDCFMWTNPKIRAEMMEQIFLWTAPRPAVRYLVFGSLKETPCEYLPLALNSYIEKNNRGEIVIPKNRREELGESIKSFFKYSVDFKRARYGESFSRTLKTMIETLNSSYLSGLLLRTLGGISFSQAFIALAYLKAMSTWYFGWVLIFSVRTLQLHETDLKTNYQLFLDRISYLDEYIRFEDFIPALTAFKGLIQNYPDDKLPKGLSKKEIFTHINKLQEEFSENNYEGLNKFMELHRIVTESAKKNPPVPAAPHKALMTLVNLSSALAMTVIATFLTLDSYNITSFDLIGIYGNSFLYYMLAFYGFDYLIPETISFLDPREESPLRAKIKNTVVKKYNACRDLFIK